MIHTTIPHCTTRPPYHKATPYHIVQHRTTPNYKITILQHFSLQHTIPMVKCERDLGERKKLYIQKCLLLFFVSPNKQKNCKCQTALFTTRINNCPRFFIYVPYTRQWRIQHWMWWITFFVTEFSAHFVAILRESHFLSLNSVTFLSLIFLFL